MDEAAAASLALDAYQALQGIHEDVAQIRGQNSDILNALWGLGSSDIPAPDGLDVQSLALDDQAVEAQPADSPALPPEFAADLMGFQWMQTVLLVFLLVAFLLNLGATLWLAFSDKWRS